MAKVKIKCCFDTNMLIEPWNKHYSPDYCNGYWEILGAMIEAGEVLIPFAVKEEIDREDDKLKAWLKTYESHILPIDADVQDALNLIYTKIPQIKDAIGKRKNISMVDVYAVAHAIVEDVPVATKEEKIMEPTSTKIKVPNLCEIMGVEPIDEWEFMRRSGIQLTASR